MTFNQAKVIIVGAGPTGMTAAMELARQGIPVRLIENTVEPETTSRAVGVQARTLELFEQRGMVDATTLSPNFTTEKGKQMFQIVQQLRLA